MVRYPELQSGFIGYPTERFLKKPDMPNQSPAALVLQPKMTRTNQDYFFSPVVEELCKQALNDPFIIRSLTFQGDVFQACGALFDKKGIFRWMQIQEEARQISALHSDFLVDTLSTVLMDRERLMIPQQWAPMLSVANDPARTPYKAARVTERVGTRPQDQLDDFLALWVRRRGVSDLLLSLQVMFGRRTLPASMGANKY